MKRLLALLLILATPLHFAVAETREVYLPDFERSFPFEGQRVVEPNDDILFDVMRPEEFGIPVVQEEVNVSYVLTKEEEVPAQSLFNQSLLKELAKLGQDNQVRFFISSYKVSLISYTKTERQRNRVTERERERE